MRQGQQNRRGRGRNNNNNNNNNGNPNRKGQNPLTRSFESTGPDVKIRGTPAHIAEKYMALARDAQSSGDPVLAENYLQHAEHYTRIIMAFREQQVGQGGDMSNMPRRPGFNDPSMGDDLDEEGGGGDDTNGDVQPQAGFARGSEPQPQPRFEGQRFDDRGDRGDRGHRGGYEGQRQPQPNRERHGGGEHRNFNDRHDRQDRQDRFQRHDRHERNDRPERRDAPMGGEPAEVGAAPQPRRSDQPPRAAVPHHEQPEFLRRPVRRPRREGNGPAEEGAPPAPAAAEDTSGRE